jgi:hypothetical protein
MGKYLSKEEERACYDKAKESIEKFKEEEAEENRQKEAEREKIRKKQESGESGVSDGSWGV